MKFYSEQTKKLYDSEKELKDAENKLALEKAEKEKALEGRKVEAQKVEDAYKKALEVRKEAYKQIDEAEKEFYKLRREFVDKYGSWHMTYSSKNDEDAYYISDAFESINKFFKDFFGW